MFYHSLFGFFSVKEVNSTSTKYKPTESEFRQPSTYRAKHPLSHVDLFKIRRQQKISTHSIFRTTTTSVEKNKKKSWIFHRVPKSATIFFAHVVKDSEAGECNFNSIWHRNLAENSSSFLLIAQKFSIVDVFLVVLNFYLTKLKGTSQIYFFPTSPTVRVFSLEYRILLEHFCQRISKFYRPEKGIHGWKIRFPSKPSAVSIQCRQ